MASSLIGRNFDSEICCEHKWIHSEFEGGICTHCGATCKRDTSGAIVKYDRPYRKIVVNGAYEALEVRT